MSNALSVAHASGSYRISEPAGEAARSRARAGELLQQGGDAADFADVKGDPEVLVAEGFGAEDLRLVGEVLFAVLADLEVETVRPGWLLDVGRGGLEGLGSGGDGKLAGLGNEDQVAGRDVVEHLDAELAGVFGERRLVGFAAGEVETVQPVGGFAVAELGVPFGNDGNGAVFTDVDEVAGVGVAVDFDAELLGVLPFLDAAFAAEQIDA